MRRRPIGQLCEAVGRPRVAVHRGTHRLRRRLVGAVYGVAWQDRAYGWGQWRDHELSHHIDGRGGGCGLTMPQVTIRPPQPGQTSTS